MSSTSIPVIDLSQFVNGNDTAKYNFVIEIGKAFEDVGFAAVKNHGVPQQLINDYYDAVQKFFSLPSETKRKYEIAELAGQRGYTSFGKEHAKGSEAPDLKEFWQMGQIVEGENLPAEHYPDNVSVTELPEFFDLGTKLYKSFEASGRNLLRAIGIHLE
ncbi:MAG: flavonol synthase, partial [Bacteroidota bacterium]|nr:flavonol synthase [Bacteroidota bacterium]